MKGQRSNCLNIGSFLYIIHSFNLQIKISSTKKYLGFWPWWPRTWRLRSVLYFRAPTNLLFLSFGTNYNKSTTIFGRSEFLLKTENMCFSVLTVNECPCVIPCVFCLAFRLSICIIDVYSIIILMGMWHVYKSSRKYKLKNVVPRIILFYFHIKKKQVRNFYKSNECRNKIECKSSSNSMTSVLKIKCIWVMG